jgi:hypothetical protein
MYLKNAQRKLKRPAETPERPVSCSAYGEAAQAGRYGSPIESLPVIVPSASSLRTSSMLASENGRM